MHDMHDGCALAIGEALLDAVVFGPPQLSPQSFQNTTRPLCGPHDTVSLSYPHSALIFLLTSSTIFLCRSIAVDRALATCTTYKKSPSST